jgi:hypothetical protein
VVGMVRGPGVAVGAVSNAYVHASDWLPSLVSMATGGKDFRDFAPPGEPRFLVGDGVDVWKSIASGGTAPLPRDWVLLECHTDSAAVHGSALIVGDLKLLQYGETAPVEEDGWFPPAGQDPAATPYTVRCTADGAPPRTGAADLSQCKTPAWCLFNVTEDPCEYYNLATARPADVSALKAKLAVFAKTAVAPNYGSGCSPTVTCVLAPLAPNSKINAYWPCDGRWGNVSSPCG